MDDDKFSATAFCPTCCSTVDVVGTGKKDLTCAHCGQVWTMHVDPELFHKYSAV
jgi:uncharacterized Zn finger protein